VLSRPGTTCEGDLGPTKDAVAVPAGATGSAGRRESAQQARDVILTASAFSLLLAVAVGIRLGANGITVRTGLLVAAPLLAVLAAVRAARPLTASAGRGWTLFAAAGALAVLSATIRLVDPDGGWNDVAGAANLACYVLLLAALALQLRPPAETRRAESMLDGALLATAACVMVLHWAPGAALVVGRTMPFTIVEQLVLSVLPAVALCVLTLGLLIMLRRPFVLSRVALGAGAAVMSLGALPAALGQSLCCEGASPAALAVIGGWGLIAVAAAAYAPRGYPDDTHLGPPLRNVTPVLVAGVMGALALQALLRPVSPLVGVAIGLLGAMLALRSAQLLRMMRDLPAERRALAQSRALVDLSRALAQTHDVDETLSLVSRWACRLVDADAAAIELVEGGGNSLVCRAAYGLPDDLIGMRFPVDGSFSGWVVTHARPRATDNVDADPFVNEASLPYIQGTSMAAAPMRYRSLMLGALTCVGRHSFTAADLELLGALGDQAALAIENARLFQQVHVLSYTDPLTGIANRRQLERDIGREFAAARRGRTLVGVMFDLDNFKHYNDTHGHVAGDAALRAFGTVLAQETRAMNLAARYGGDEFFVLLADATEADAAVFVQRVLSRYREEVRKLGHDPIGATAGFAVYQPEMRAPEALIDAADRALYDSKRERAH